MVIFTIPFLSHQSGLPEQPVHLVGIAATPECQYGAQGLIRLAVSRTDRNISFPERTELLALFGCHGFGNDGLIREVAAGDFPIHIQDHRRFHHVLFQNGHQLLTAVNQITFPDDIAGQSDELTCVTRHIHFQSQFLVIDKIFGFIIGEVAYRTENADTFSGRAVFGIASHGLDDIQGEIGNDSHIDTVINVDGGDVIKDSNADTIASIQTPAGGFKVCEAPAVRGIGTLAVGLIGDFGHAVIPFFQSPVAEESLFFQLVG